MGQASPAELGLNLLKIVLSNMITTSGALEDRHGSVLIKIKYHILKALGFSDVRLVPSSQTGQLDVSTNSAKPPTLQRASVVALSSLKTVLDSAPRKLDEFLDIVPRILTSGVDFSSLPNSTLSLLLDNLMITIYKHSFVSSLSSSFLASLRTLCGVLQLPTTSSPTRQHIVLIFLLFLQRYESINSAIVLEQLISVVRAFRPEEIGSNEAGQFIRRVFTQFGGQGLSGPLLQSLGDFPLEEDRKRTFQAISAIVKTGGDVFDGVASIPMRELLYFDLWRSLLSKLSTVVCSVMATLATCTTGCTFQWSLELLRGELFGPGKVHRVH